MLCISNSTIRFIITPANLYTYTGCMNYVTFKKYCVIIHNTVSSIFASHSYTNIITIITVFGKASNEKYSFMNITHIRETDQKFLLRAIRFCNSISAYTDTLGLSDTEVALFKNELEALLYISENYKSFSISFILHNIGAMRCGLKVLTLQCIQSMNYNINIGKALGIREQAKIDSATLLELNFYRSCKN